MTTLGPPTAPSPNIESVGPISKVSDSPAKRAYDPEPVFTGLEGPKKTVLAPPFLSLTSLRSGDDVVAEILVVVIAVTLTCAHVRKAFAGEEMARTERAFSFPASAELLTTTLVPPESVRNTGEVAILENPQEV
jgi:hypothetical protein